MPATLIVTSDFPPGSGHQSFVADIAELLGRDIVVHVGRLGRYRRFSRGYPVIETGPCCRVRLARRTAASSAFGASRVIGSCASDCSLLRSARRGGDRGLTHGHETWWAAVPGARRLAPDRRRVHHLTAISGYTARGSAPR
jgi:phosphatidylinositol alpha-1,6-mannosyltransferase